MVDKLVVLGCYHLFVVCVGSVVCASWDIPCFAFFCDKFNPLNQYIVKLCWGWTMSVVSGYVLFRVLGEKEERGVLYKMLMRLLLGTFIWYTGTGLIDTIQNTYGSCVFSYIGQDFALKSNKTDCRELGGTWVPVIEISGHIFMMVFCDLFLTWQLFPNKEKTKKYDKLGDLIHEDDELEMQHYNATDEDEDLLLDTAPLTPLPTPCQAFCYRMYAMIKVLGFTLCLVFRFMIVITVMYFHTTAEKIIGVYMGVLLFMLSQYITS